MREMTALPKLDAGLVIVAAMLELQRDERGHEWCLEEGIGGLRREKLGMLPRTVLVGDIAVLQDDDDAEGPRNKASAVLKGICKFCRHTRCPLNGK